MADIARVVGLLQSFHDAVVNTMKQKVNQLEDNRIKLSSGDNPEFDRGYYKCIEDMRTVCTQVEFENWRQYQEGAREQIADLVQ